MDVAASLFRHFRFRSAPSRPRRRPGRSGCAWLLAVLLALPSAGMAADADADADELARQLSNPVASLVSVPLQFNYDELDSGGSRAWVNVQPVVPVSIGEHWNMISRTILPITYQEDLFPGAGSQFGTGDITQSLFFSPKQPTAGGWIVGFGPAVLVPTASDDLLGTGKWGAGPTAVVLRQTQAGWTYGALVNHLWSFAGDSDRNDVSSTFLQPFLTRGMGQGRTLSLNLESSYNWETRQWTVPVNIGYSKVSRIGAQMVSYQGGVRYYAESPAGGPDWGLRFAFTLLFPES
ncbi:transporter [Pseudoxanthomonas sp. 10H]|uniref:transporter n=1 Tax=Pseudoxanthomonas sp. 10H TaxID=3242729 RepID=UPI0035585162